MTQTQAVDASIDFLSSIPEEVLQGSGPCGRVYDLQLKLARTETQLDYLRNDLFYEAERTRGSLSDAHEMVEHHPDVVAQRARVEELQEMVRVGHAEVGGIVFLPAVQNLGQIEKRLATLNRKASKIGTGEITLTTTDEKLLLSYKASDEDTRAYDFEHVFAVLSGATPQIPGYEFLATITPTEHGNVVKRIPPIRYGIQHNLEFEERDSEGNRRVSTAQTALDAIDLTRFHTTGDMCEHCHKDRRRSDLYVVYNEKTGQAIQVGRTCLRDYMGSNDPERILRHLEQVMEFMRSVGSRGVTPDMPTDEFMTHCATIMRIEAGYKKGLGHDATRNYYNLIRDARDRKGERLYVIPTDFDRAEGASTLRWAREEWDETSEFATNVKLSLAGAAMDAKLVGLGGAAFVARTNWFKYAGERAEREQRLAAREAANAKKGHIGTVGQREVFTLTLTDIKWIPDRYAYGEDATKPLLIMTDETGNEVKWFASSLPGVADQDTAFPVRGGIYQVKATVKSHEESEQYGKSTVITRAKFEKTISEPETAQEEND